MVILNEKDPALPKLQNFAIQNKITNPNRDIYIRRQPVGLIWLQCTQRFSTWMNEKPLPYPASHPHGSTPYCSWIWDRLCLCCWAMWESICLHQEGSSAVNEFKHRHWSTWNQEKARIVSWRMAMDNHTTTTSLWGCKTVPWDRLFNIDDRHAAEGDAR